MSLDLVRQGAPSDAPGRGRLRVDRRGFLRTAAMAGAVVALRPIDLLAWREGPDALGRAGHPRRVLVLGAGVAGLAAAIELSGAGHDVTILEGRPRAGGRVRTLRGLFADDLHVEAGAGRIPSSHDLTLAYVRRYGLPLQPFLPPGASLFHLDGVSVRDDEPGFLRRLGVPVDDGSSGLAARASAALSGALAALGEVTDAGWPGPDARAYDGMTAADLMRAHGLPEGAIRFFDLGIGLFEHISGLELLMQAGSVFAPKSKIAGGMDRLPEAMAREVSGRIRYGTEVLGLRQDDSGVEVRVRGPQGEATVTADRAICTLPFCVLRGLSVEPSLPAARRRAVEELAYDRVTRVYLQTRDRFWRRKGLSGFAWTDWPTEIWDASDGQRGERGVLMSYLRSESAVRMAGLPPDERVRSTAGHFDAVLPGVRPRVEAGRSWSWAEEPFARAAYAEWRPGELSRLYPHMAAPEGRLHFAGEHISPWPGWIQGALHSGLRAAREVHEAAS